MVKYARGRLLALLSLLLLAAPGCGPAPPDQSTPPIGMTDQLGRPVRLSGVPRRIVSLAPSNTEILFALGLADRVVGVTDYDNYPPEVKGKASIGGFSTPNLEQVIALTPDLVLAASIHEKQVIPQLESRGLTVVALAPRTVSQVFEAITMVGRITSKEAEASRLVAEMQGRVKRVTDQTAGLTGAKRPRVLFIVWHDPLMTAGSGTFHDELIRLAGGTNIVEKLSGYPSISLEAVIDADPEVVIAGVGMGTGADAPLQFVRTEPRLRDVSARQNNRLYAVDQDVVGRAGPRIVDALEQFAGFIHPELFK